MVEIIGIQYTNCNYSKHYKKTKKSTMSTTRSRSRTGRKFGKDITNVVNLVGMPHSKQQILNKAKPTISSVHSISLLAHPRSNSLMHLQDRPNRYNEKMIDQNTSWLPVGFQETMAVKHRDPVYDHADQIQYYVREQSELAVIQENYMQWQVEIDKEKREILVSWLIGIHHAFNLKPETLFLAIHLVDQYGYKKCVLRSRYQLLGITCLFMAAKYEELRTPRLAKYLSECGGLYMREQMLSQEAQILEVMNFQINQIVLTKYLMDLGLDQILLEIERESIISEQISEEEKQLAAKLCSYILELTLVQYSFCLLRPRYISPVIIYISLKIKNIPGIRSKRLLEMYDLDQQYFRECFQQVNKLYKSRREPRFMEINRKYGIYQQSKSTICTASSTYTSTTLPQQH